MHNMDSDEESPRRNRGVLVTCRSFVTCLRSFMIPGYGMFSEAFFLFSVGNLKKGIFPVSYPHCWNSNSTLNDECPHEELKDSISYTMIGGVILGMIAISIFGDSFGRRAGSILTAVTMFCGAILLVCSSGPTLEGEFYMFTIALAVFGVGVGGEYPLASSSATERATSPANRGQTVVLTFSMQGVGNWVYTSVLLLLLYTTGIDWSSSIDEYEPDVLNRIWRVTYAIGAVGLFILVTGRILFLEESKHFEMRKESGQKKFQCGGIGHFWHRLFGTSVSWFVWDVTFYGNKLFQGTFIKEIVGADITPFKTLVYVLINSSVALVGYYVAAYTIDRKWMGRRGMQAMGFAMTCILFLACGIFYDKLTHQPLVFQILYYISSFFGQWGPNATTWLLPSEIFPTEVRATAHGWSAACGKVGALVAGVLFGLKIFKTNPMYTFIISGVCGFVGLVVTILFIPEAGAVSLDDLDLYWDQRRAGILYEGPVVHKKNRSLCERMCGFTTMDDKSVKLLGDER